MSRLLRLTAALVLAGLWASCATSSGAGGQASSGEGVSLRFAWPQDFAAQVSSTSVETKSGQRVESPERRVEIRLEGTGQERKLVTRQLPATGPGAGPEEARLPPTPTLVLGPAGELKRVEGIDQALAEVFKDAQSKGVPKAQQDMLAKLVGEALEQAARARWEELLGKWNGLTLKPGEVVERRSQMIMPFFGNTVDIQERLSLKQYVPCTEGGADKRCVLLVLDSTLDPAGDERARSELVQRMKEFTRINLGMPESALPEMKVTKLQLDGSLELITEPGTLIPHRLRDTETAVIVMQSSDGETQDFNLKSERREVFTPGAR